mmetsp:Transcript_64042/g.164798  ORF Transcript_64042/g.164798 Transcript_64042/m.164798 type:complete len:541 (+) Transcript_64042:59-1681(+)
MVANQQADVQAFSAPHAAAAHERGQLGPIPVLRIRRAPPAGGSANADRATGPLPASLAGAAVVCSRRNSGNSRRNSGSLPSKVSFTEVTDADGALERTLGRGTYQLGVLVGVGMLLYSVFGAFHLLPVFLDVKLAADPTLPGLTKESLPIASTAMFAGWLLGSAGIGQATDRLGKKQVMRLGALGLLVSVFAQVALPSLTGGSIAALATVRLFQGVFFSIGPVASTFAQECVPKAYRNRVMVGLNTAYSLIAASMSYLCGTVTLNADWRMEALIWCGMPMLAALAVGLPFVHESLSDLMVKGKAKEASEVLHSIARTNGCDELAEGLVLRQSEGTKEAQEDEKEDAGASVFKGPLLMRLVALAICFVTCGSAFFGLTYSAGNLSPNMYLNSVVLNLADILGYAIALSADKYGLRLVQGGSFAAAGVCLLGCALLPPGSFDVLACAVLGRLFLDVCFTTIYVAVVANFPGRARTGAMVVCQLAARLGGVWAPYCGTLPVAVSCSIFGALCLLSAALTLAFQQDADEEDEQEVQGTKAVEII